PAAHGRTRGRCWPRAPAPGLPPRSTRRPRARYSCWKSWCADSSRAWPLPRSPPRPARSSSAASCWATLRTSTSAPCPTLLPRAALGAVSYAAGTPGGLFAPLLVLGAQLGLIVGMLGRMAFPDLDIAPEGFAVVGMAAFFAGVVRAPVTGITLVVEMTANV